MNQQEKNFYARIQKMLPGHVQRIESSTGCGIPDVNICYQGREFWIELKVWQPCIGILIRKEQWAWHARRMQAGGKCFVLAYEPTNDACFFNGTFLVKVKPYGTACKYVVITNPADMIQFPRKNLGDTLRTILFT